MATEEQDVLAAYLLSSHGFCEEALCGPPEKRRVDDFDVVAIAREIQRQCPASCTDHAPETTQDYHRAQVKLLVTAHAPHLLQRLPALYAAFEGDELHLLETVARTAGVPSNAAPIPPCLSFVANTLVQQEARAICKHSAAFKSDTELFSSARSAIVNDADAWRVAGEGVVRLHVGEAAMAKLLAGRVRPGFQGWHRLEERQGVPAHSRLGCSWSAVVDMVMSKFAGVPPRTVTLFSNAADGAIDELDGCPVSDDFVAVTSEAAVAAIRDDCPAAWKKVRRIGTAILGRDDAQSTLAGLLVTLCATDDRLLDIPGWHVAADDVSPPDRASTSRNDGSAEGKQRALFDAWQRIEHVSEVTGSSPDAVAAELVEAFDGNWFELAHGLSLEVPLFRGTPPAPPSSPRSTTKPPKCSRGARQAATPDGIFVREWWDCGAAERFVAGWDELAETCGSGAYTPSWSLISVPDNRGRNRCYTAAYMVPVRGLPTAPISAATVPDALQCIADAVGGGWHRENSQCRVRRLGSDGDTYALRLPTEPREMAEYAMESRLLVTSIARFTALPSDPDVYLKSYAYARLLKADAMCISVVYEALQRPLGDLQRPGINAAIATVPITRALNAQYVLRAFLRSSSEALTRLTTEHAIEEVNRLKTVIGMLKVLPARHRSKNLIVALCCCAASFISANASDDTPTQSLPPLSVEAEQASQLWRAFAVGLATLARKTLDRDEPTFFFAASVVLTVLVPCNEEGTWEAPCDFRPDLHELVVRSFRDFDRTHNVAARWGAFLDRNATRLMMKALDEIIVNAKSRGSSFLPQGIERRAVLAICSDLRVGIWTRGFGRKLQLQLLVAFAARNVSRLAGFQHLLLCALNHSAFDILAEEKQARDDIAARCHVSLEESRSRHAILADGARAAMQLEEQQRRLLEGSVEETMRTAVMGLAKLSKASLQIGEASIQRLKLIEEALVGSARLTRETYAGVHARELLVRAQAFEEGARHILQDRSLAKLHDLRVAQLLGVPGRAQGVTAMGKVMKREAAARQLVHVDNISARIQLLGRAGETTVELFDAELVHAQAADLVAMWESVETGSREALYRSASDHVRWASRLPRHTEELTNLCSRHHRTLEAEYQNAFAAFKVGLAEDRARTMIAQTEASLREQHISGDFVASISADVSFERRVLAVLIAEHRARAFVEQSEAAVRQGFADGTGLLDLESVDRVAGLAVMQIAEAVARRRVVDSEEGIRRDHMTSEWSLSEVTRQVAAAEQMRQDVERSMRRQANDSAKRDAVATALKRMARQGKPAGPKRAPGPAPVKAQLAPPPSTAAFGMFEDMQRGLVVATEKYERRHLVATLKLRLLDSQQSGSATADAGSVAIGKRTNARTLVPALQALRTPEQTEETEASLRSKVLRDEALVRSALASFVKARLPKLVLDTVRQGSRDVGRVQQPTYSSSAAQQDAGIRPKVADGEPGLLDGAQRLGTPVGEDWGALSMMLSEAEGFSRTALRHAEARERSSLMATPWPKSARRGSHATWQEQVLLDSRTFELAAGWLLRAHGIGRSRFEADEVWARLELGRWLKDESKRIDEERVLDARAFEFATNSIAQAEEDARSALEATDERVRREAAVLCHDEKMRVENAAANVEEMAALDGRAFAYAASHIAGTETVARAKLDNSEAQERTEQAVHFRDARDRVVAVIGATQQQRRASTKPKTTRSPRKNHHSPVERDEESDRQLLELLEVKGRQRLVSLQPASQGAAPVDQNASPVNTISHSPTAQHPPTPSATVTSIKPKPGLGKRPPRLFRAAAVTQGASIEAYEASARRSFEVEWFNTYPSHPMPKRTKPQARQQRDKQGPVVAAPSPRQIKAQQLDVVDEESRRRSAIDTDWRQRVRYLVQQSRNVLATASLHQLHAPLARAVERDESSARQSVATVESQDFVLLLRLFASGPVTIARSYATAPRKNRAAWTARGDATKALDEATVRDQYVLFQAEKDQRVAIERKWQWNLADIVNRDRQDRGVLRSAVKPASPSTVTPTQVDAVPQPLRFANLFSFVGSVIEELEVRERASVEAAAWNGFEEFDRAAMGVAGVIAVSDTVELTRADVLPLSLAAREHPDADVPRLIATGQQVGLAWPLKRGKRQMPEAKPRPSTRGRALESQEASVRSEIVRTWQTRVVFMSKVFVDEKRAATDNEKRRLTAAAGVQPDAGARRVLLDAAAALTVLSPATASALLGLEKDESVARDELEEALLRASFADALRRKGAMLGIASPSSNPTAAVRSVKATTPGARRPPRLAPLIVRSVTTTPPPPASNSRVLQGDERLHSPHHEPLQQAHSPQTSPVLSKQPPRAIGRFLREEETARAALRAEVLEWQNRTAMRLLAPPRRTRRGPGKREEPVTTEGGRLTPPVAHADPPPVLVLCGDVSAELGELVEDWESSGRAEIAADWLDSWKALSVKESVWRGGLASLRRPAEMRFTRRIVRSEMRGPKRPTFSKPKPQGPSQKPPAT